MQPVNRWQILAIGINLFCAILNMVLSRAAARRFRASSQLLQRSRKLLDLSERRYQLFIALYEVLSFEAEHEGVLHSEKVRGLIGELDEHYREILR